MLYLLFHLGEDRYALEARQVVEVLPFVSVKRIAQTARGVAGVFSYRGTLAPVIDLSELVSGQPARLRLSTRIILINYPDATGSQRLLGLIAEKVTETLRREPAEFSVTGVASEAAPYLGPVTSDERGLVQRVEVDQLLPESMRNLLFREPLPQP